MANRATADIGLGNLAHGDGAHDAAVHTGMLKRVLKREGVHYGGEHAHRVALGSIHATGRNLDAAEDVAAADNDRDLDAGVKHGTNLLGKASRDSGIDTELLITHKGFAGKLEQDALIPKV